MKKIFGIIKKAFLNEMLYRIELDSAIAVLFVLLIILVFTPSDTVLTKIIAVGYVVSTICIIIFLRIPCIPTEMEFRKTSIWSFLTWNVFYAVISGIIIGCIVSKVRDCDIIKSSISATLTVTIVIAIAWFGCHVLMKKDNTAELDCYSSIMVAILTLLSLAVDYSSVKTPFIIIFFIYLLIQIMIKIKICIIKNNMS